MNRDKEVYKQESVFWAGCTGTEVPK